MTAKSTAEPLAALNLNELDFNVSDEEISHANKAWSDSLDATTAINFLEIKSVQHPM